MFWVNRNGLCYKQQFFKESVYKYFVKCYVEKIWQSQHDHVSISKSVMMGLHFTLFFVFFAIITLILLSTGSTQEVRKSSRHD